MSIYTSLFKYRPRVLRRPLEDFLSQALADLLNRLPREEIIDFVADVLLGSEASNRMLWHQFVRAKPDAKFHWATQVNVTLGRTRGIIDMVLRVDGHEVIIVENKIGAPIRVQDVDGFDEDPAGAETTTPRVDSNQLRMYGKWLSSCRKDDEWKGALVLLTHFTEPPDDFVFGSSAYGVSTVSACSWRAVWAWTKATGRGFTQIGSEKSPAVSSPTKLWRSLCQELAEFLEEERMSADYMTFHDVAALEIYVGSDDRIENTFALVNKKIEPLRRKLGGPPPKIYGPQFDSAGGVLWGWVYLREPKQVYDNWSISWGIRFPSVSTDWWTSVKPPLPGAPHVFVAAYADREPRLQTTKAIKNKLPKGWSASDDAGELIIARPLYDFRHDPEGWAEDFADWAATEASLIYPVLTEMAATLR